MLSLITPSLVSHLVFLTRRFTDVNTAQIQTNWLPLHRPSRNQCNLCYPTYFSLAHLNSNPQLAAPQNAKHTSKGAKIPGCYFHLSVIFFRLGWPDIPVRPGQFLFWLACSVPTNMHLDTNMSWFSTISIKLPQFEGYNDHMFCFTVSSPTSI